MTAADPVAELVEGVKAGDRRALARAITLAESTRTDHREQAMSVLDAVLPSTGGATRVGVSGAPGVGKSMFIEALGLHLVGGGHKVAVLAVDPSSARSGGSILGDKTRMSELAREPAAFIRPSPSGGTLGGVARRTHEALLLCEAAGFDVVLVETVGVGQSETAVADMVDTFVLLVQPGGGDELQGIKRGIVELADIVVVTKADGDLADSARRAEADYRHAVQFMRTRHAGWDPPVVPASALTGVGIDGAWRAAVDHRAWLRSHELLDHLRAEQAKAWMWSEVRDQLFASVLTADVQRLAAGLERDVAQRRTSPSRAAAELLDRAAR